MIEEPKKIDFVLLADDDDDDTMLFVEAARSLSSSLKVSLANDGQKLLTLLETSEPDVVFLDLNMPRKDGLECLKSIRSNDKHSNLPVVIYSTSQNNRDIEACYKAGANYYVVKPYNFEDILVVLKKLFFQLPKPLTIPSPKEQFLINTYRQE